MIIKLEYRFLKITCHILFLNLWNLNYSSATSEQPQIKVEITKPLSINFNKSESHIKNKQSEVENLLSLSRRGKDTINIIRHLIDLSDINRFAGNYDKAFDNLWEAQLLANNRGDSLSSVKILRNIGILYSIYDFDSLAIDHIRQSLFLCKKLNCSDNKNENQIISSYFALSNIYRKNEDFDKAMAFLDSCQQVRPNKFMPYVAAEKGYIFLKTDRTAQARPLLDQAHHHFRSKNLDYCIVTSLFMGELMGALKKTDSAQFYFNACLKLIESRKVFPEYKPQVLERLAEISYEKKNFMAAFQFLLQARNSWQELFNAANEQNRRLFEIKNQFRDQLVHQELLIEKQNNELLLKEKTVFRLLFIVSLLIFMGISSGFIFYLKFKVNRFKLLQKLTREKNLAILEHKNKELITYTLQVIDREKVVEELLKTIKDVCPSKYNNLKKKFGKPNSKLWEEFNLRFLEINGSFYEKLRTKHPDLTPTELKHCALIKLNLDSAEMAQILNISLQSVHTSRYRIRKKLKLSHEESLPNYIASL